jgi:nucleoside-diphosphate-sugar epimerase
MKIAILGTGWLGKPLAKSLQQQGHQIRVSTRSEENYQELQEDFGHVFRIQIGNDLLSDTLLTFLSNIDILIITIPPDRKTHPDTTQLDRLIPYIQQSGISKVIYTSSIGVYPLLNKTVGEETTIEHITHPCFLNEQALSQSQGFQTTTLRLAGLIGGRRHPGNFFKKKGIITNCEAPVNLVHRLDCIAAIEQVIQQESWGTCYNICADTHPSRGVFYTAALNAIGEKAPICQKAEHPSFKTVSSNKIKTQLGFKYIHGDLLHLITSNPWV